MSAIASVARARSEVERLRRPELVLSPIVTAVAIGLWWLASDRGLISSIILPAPDVVLLALITLLQEPWYISDIGVTAFEAVSGFVAAAVLGVTMAVVLSFLRAARKIAYPYIVAFQVIPTVAIAPIFIVGLGYGTTSKVAIAFFISFFPIVVNTLAGLDRVPFNSDRLMTSLTASRRQKFVMLTFPTALPYIFAGFKAGVTLALIGAIVGEYILAQAGLGKRLIEFGFAFKPDLVWATIVVISVVGLVMYAIVALAQTRVVFWRN